MDAKYFGFGKTDTTARVAWQSPSVPHTILTRNTQDNFDVLNTIDILTQMNKLLMEI